MRICEARSGAVFAAAVDLERPRGARLIVVGLRAVRPIVEGRMDEGTCEEGVPGLFGLASRVAAFGFGWMEDASYGAVDGTVTGAAR